MKQNRKFSLIITLTELSLVIGMTSIGFNVLAEPIKGSGSELNIREKTLFKMNLVEDGPGKAIEKAILFLGDLSATKSQVNVIEALPHTQFIVMVSSNLGKNLIDRHNLQKLYEYKNVKLQFLDYPVASWAQDRLLRQEGAITGVYTDHMKEMLSIYETNAVSRAKQEMNLEGAGYESFLQISQYNGKDPFTIKNKENIPHYLKSNVSNLFYGDGGDRIVLKDYILMGGNSLRESAKLGKSNGFDSIETIEAQTGKKIISMDTGEEREGSIGYSQRYAYHLDLFITPVGDNTVVLGSYERALDMLPTNLDWVDYDKMKTKAALFTAIKNQLNLLGLKTIEIPLIIDTDNQIISFNNGVFNNSDFYLSSYNFKNESKNYWIKMMSKLSQSAYNAQGIEPKFVTGGENNLPFGGQIRCMVAIVKTGSL